MPASATHRGMWLSAKCHGAKRARVAGFHEFFVITHHLFKTGWVKAGGAPDFRDDRAIGFEPAHVFDASGDALWRPGHEPRAGA